MAGPVGGGRGIVCIAVLAGGRIGSRRMLWVVVVVGVVAAVAWELGSM